MGHLFLCQHVAFLILVPLFLLVLVMSSPIVIPFLVFRLVLFPFMAAQLQLRAVTSVAPFV